MRSFNGPRGEGLGWGLNEQGPLANHCNLAPNAVNKVVTESQMMIFPDPLVALIPIVCGIWGLARGALSPPPGPAPLQPETKPNQTESVIKNTKNPFPDL